MPKQVAKFSFENRTLVEQNFVQVESIAFVEEPNILLEGLKSQNRCKIITDELPRLEPLERVPLFC